MYNRATHSSRTFDGESDGFDMTARPDDAWVVLRERLPGLRKPPAGTGVRRREVGAHLAEIEATVEADPASAFEWDGAGAGRLRAGGRMYRAGWFETSSVGELEAVVRGKVGGEAGTGRVNLSVLVGTGPLTDVGMLQAMAGPAALFQVASQFNCLEAPAPAIVRIARYVDDNTQGPRASVSAFPGTFLRHYAAPAGDGHRFVQGPARHLNLLADAVSPDVARVDCGYLRAGGVADAGALQESLETRFEHIRVGVHDGVEVGFGGDWGGPVDAAAPTIAQVFTSTIALGAYSFGAADVFQGCSALLLRASYLGTLLAALARGKRTVVLTLIGGGAFGNSLRRIWDSIVWAVDRAAAFAPADLQVVVNGRDGLGAVRLRVRHSRLAGALSPCGPRGGARARSRSTVQGAAGRLLPRLPRSLRAGAGPGGGAGIAGAASQWTSSPAPAATDG